MLASIKWLGSPPGEMEGFRLCHPNTSKLSMHSNRDGHRNLYHFLVGTSEYELRFSNLFLLCNLQIIIDILKEWLKCFTDVTE